MKKYTVEYTMTWSNEIRDIEVLASNKEDAYDRAVYEEIPAKEGEHAYSAWVDSVVFANGNRRWFNTHEGKPY